MQDYFKYAIDWLDAHNLTVVAVILLVIVAIVRSLKKRGKIDWLEGVLCGCLTLTIVSALEYLALPIQLSIFVGDIVGFKGTLWVDRMISKKVGEES